MVIHRDSHLDSMQEWETSELLNPKRDVFILTSPLKSQEFIEKRSGETIKARGSRWFKKTAFSKHSTEDKHMNSLILWQLIQDPHKLKSDELPEWRRGHGHKAPLLAWHYYQRIVSGRGKIDFLHWSHTGYIHRPRQAQWSIVAQYKTVSVFCVWWWGVDLLLFLRERKNMKLGELWEGEESWREKNMI